MTILTILDSVSIMGLAYFGAFVTVVWMITANKPNDVYSKRPTKWIDEN